MKKVKLNIKALHKVVATKHKNTKVGEIYFLSNFHDKEGATIKVLRKSTEKNRAGFNSSVIVEVLDSDCAYYKVGAVHTVNAANLYKERKFASPAFKFGWEK